MMRCPMVLIALALLVGGCADPNDARSRDGAPKVGDKRVIAHFFPVFPSLDALRYHLAHRLEEGYHLYPRGPSDQPASHRPVGDIEAGQAVEVLELGRDFVRVQYLNPLTNSGVSGYAEPFW